MKWWHEILDDVWYQIKFWSLAFGISFTIALVLMMIEYYL